MRRGFYFLILFIFLFSSASFVFAEVANHVVISEIQIAGTKTTDDFIELYNPTDKEINLDNYRLIKRTKVGETDTTIKSFGAGDNIPAFGFYLWVNSSYLDASSLPDATTSQTIAADNGIALRFGAENTGIIIDSVGWGEAANIFVEGDVFSSNPSAGKSIERNPGANFYDKGNGEDTENNTSDFILRNTPEPQNKSSAIEIPEGMELPQETTPTYSTKIYINEFLPAPGSFTDWDGDGEASPNDEWIELINLDATVVDLANWVLDDVENDGSSSFTVLGGTIIQPDAFTVFYKKDTGLVLNNTGDSILLKNPAGEICDQYSFTSTSTDKSFSRINNGPGDWTDAYSPSPGALNQAPMNHYPFASAGSDINNAVVGETVNFNGSASYDSDGQINDYSWNFGDGQLGSGPNPSHVYLNVGTYQVVLTVKDNGGYAGTDFLNVSVVKSTEDNSSVPEGSSGYQNQYSDKIKIIGFLPNPAGSDNEKEYIELFNFGPTAINLKNWTLDDIEGGSKPYLIKTDNVISADSHLVFYRPETKIAINNNGDSLRLFDPDGELVDNVSFDETSLEDNPYVLRDGKWGWKIGKKEESVDLEKENPEEKQEKITPKQTEIIPVSSPAPAKSPLNLNKILPASPVVKKSEETATASSYNPVILVESDVSAPEVLTENKKLASTQSNISALTKPISNPKKPWPLSPFFVVPMAFLAMAGIVKFIILPKNIYEFLDKILNEDKRNEELENIFK